MLGGVGFDAAAGSNGYVRRVRSIDAALGPLRRVYVRVVPEAGRPAVFARISENVFELTVNETPIDRRCSSRLLRKPLASIRTRSIRWSIKRYRRFSPKQTYPFWTSTASSRRDDVTLRSRADVLYDLERSVIGAASHLVSVTRRMKNHFIGKYPGIDESKFINIPIMISSPRYPVVRERSLLTEGALYAGSLDSWQNIDVMLKAVEASGMRTDILTADPAGFWNAFGHLAQPIKEKLTVKACFQKMSFGSVPKVSIRLRPSQPIRSKSSRVPHQTYRILCGGDHSNFTVKRCWRFSSLGLQFIPLDMFSDGKLPSRVVRAEMMSENALVF